MRAHLIKDGIVFNTVEIESLADASTFWPDLEAIEATEGSIGWLWDGENLSPPPRWPSLEAGKTQVLSDLAARRYQAETAGITVAGVKVATDRESQASLTGAFTSMKSGLLTSIDWKGDDGWVVFDLPTCEALAQAVANHVQQCFTREKVLAEQIDAAQSIEALEAIDIGSGWPA